MPFRLPIQRYYKLAAGRAVQGFERTGASANHDFERAARGMFQEKNKARPPSGMKGFVGLAGV
jgi:hypothetical protein